MSEKLRRRYLGVIEGGRAQLERQALRAVVFDLPDATELIRRLAACANNAMMRLIEANPSEQPARRKGGECNVASNDR